MATHATTLVEWESADGAKIKVPPGVRAALQTKYRGQDLGPKALAILGFFNEKPVLKATQRKVDDSSPHDPLALTSAANVSTELSLKADPSKKWISGFNRIICTRLLEHVLECKHVPDDDKLKLIATSGSSAAAKKWKLECDAKQVVAQKTPDRKLGAAELAALTPAERAARMRQQSLSERTVQKLSAAQVDAINFALATFFFICHIPFSVIEHWAFVALIAALCPAYAPFLFKRTALSGNWLDKLYDETEEKMEQKLDDTMGKQTVIIDGFKDVRK